MRYDLDQFEVLNISFELMSISKSPTRGRKIKSPMEIRDSARPEYLATSPGRTLSESRTKVHQLGHMRISTDCRKLTSSDEREDMSDQGDNEALDGA
jgi:hypothetical protein